MTLHVWILKRSRSLLLSENGNLAIFHGPRCLARFDAKGNILKPKELADVQDKPTSDADVISSGLCQREQLGASPQTPGI